MVVGVGDEEAVVILPVELKIFEGGVDVLVDPAGSGRGIDEPVEPALPDLTQWSRPIEWHQSL